FASVANDAAVGTSYSAIVYSSATGNLFYNSDGAIAGLGTGAQFATVTGIPAVSANDFVLQA
ncbi:MAG: M10 family metallopeptidase C-terminal domain-containing protein, partial [Xenococcaceae cyanobacterium]